MEPTTEVVATPEVTTPVAPEVAAPAVQGQPEVKPDVIVEVPADRFECSAKEFGEMVGVEYAAAQGFIKVLQKVGQATLTRTRPQPSGKGKPTNLYSLPRQLTLNLDPQAKAAA